MEEIKKSLQEIHQDVKIACKDIVDLKVDTAVNTISLKEHMRRTEASEKRIRKIEDRQFKEKMYTGGLVALLAGITEIIRRIF